MTLTPQQVRKDIPFLEKYVYLDNGATTPVPLPVQKAMEEYYNGYLANVERGAYSVAHEASEHFEKARADSARLLLCCSPEEFIFTRSMTHSSNMVAYGLEHPRLDMTENGFQFGRPVVEWKQGDMIIGTVLEHHANTLPWIRLAKRNDLEFISASPARDQTLSPEDFLGLITEKTKLVAFQHVSNALGSIHPVKEITHAIKKENPGCLVFIDGSQGPGHVPVDVKEIGCDFYGFSGHKGPLGPQGTGGLYIRRGLIENMEPMEVGGGIISDVMPPEYRLRSDDPAKKFGSGTPNIPGMIGLGRAAIYTMEEIGIDAIDHRERELASRLIEGIESFPGIHIYGPENIRNRGGVVTFNIEGWMCHDVSNALDSKWNILTRSGHHCCIPLSRWLGIWDDYHGNVRASFGYYNTEAEVDMLIDALATLTGA
ncbi:MAG: cysteine desulfurase [Candidatus Thermoplasmatota archaeon]|nr:cysteine desulfurase [Candidatus Thermoplasmatota archaeon]